MKIHDKEFEVLIHRHDIQNRVIKIAEEINKEYKDKKPLLIGIMNGSFLFAADLFRNLTIEAEISFIKLLSYKGTSSSNNVVRSIGLEETVNNRHIIIIEDIVDTGRTLHSFLPELTVQNPSSLKIATLLFKPLALKHDIKPDYVGFEIENDFVVGYGLDYDGLGRNLNDIFVTHPTYP